MSGFWNRQVLLDIGSVQTRDPVDVCDESPQAGQRPGFRLGPGRDRQTRDPLMKEFRSSGLIELDFRLGSNYVPVYTKLPERSKSSELRLSGRFGDFGWFSRFAAP